jgi:hypothetical protein
VQQRQRTHGGLTPPALGTVRTAVCRNNDDFFDAQTHVHKSGGRQPAVVFGKRTCRNAAVKSRETAGTLLTSAGAAAPANPRGAYAPRSCIALRTSVGEKTIFSMHKRTLTRAAGVSPPWRTFDRACKAHRSMSGEQRPPDQERRALARRGAESCICNGDRLFRTQHVRPGTIGSHPTAGLHQPLLVGCAAAFAQ